MGPLSLTTEFYTPHPARTSPFRKNSPASVEGLDTACFNWESFRFGTVSPSPPGCREPPCSSAPCFSYNSKGLVSERVGLFCSVLFFFGVGGSLRS